MTSLLEKTKTQTYQEERNTRIKESAIIFKARKKSPKEIFWLFALIIFVLLNYVGNDVSVIEDTQPAVFVFFGALLSTSRWPRITEVIGNVALSE